VQRLGSSETIPRSAFVARQLLGPGTLGRGRGTEKKVVEEGTNHVRRQDRP